MLIFVIIVLILIIGILIFYNINIHKRISVYNNINEKITNLNLLQDFFDIVASELEFDDKLLKINDAILEKFSIKYSTICSFDGTRYKIRASNQDKTFLNTLSNLSEAPIFKDCIQNGTYQILKCKKEGDKLPYQNSDLWTSKSCVFFPLYIDNIYIGYWIIEGTNPEDFDLFDFSILEMIRNNIVSSLRAIENQGIIENITRNDKFSHLQTEEYMYGKAKKIIDSQEVSTICMFEITNIEEVNNKFGRSAGNELIAKVSSMIEPQLSRKYIFVRYNGPKFVIVFTGVEEQSAARFMAELKPKVESLIISKNEEITFSPALNVVLTPYYKGTALDVACNNLNDYLSTTTNNSNSINLI